MRPLRGIISVCLVLVAGCFSVGCFKTAEQAKPPLFARHRTFNFDKFTMIWGSKPFAASTPANPYSNIEPQDYVGADKCAACHEEKYRTWSQHPHRWMNAAAGPERVFGDFSGSARIRNLGGEGRFWREGDQFFMSAERGAVRRRYRITRTIGSRYFQYYIGLQLQGPELPQDLRYKVEHVLPFGFWLRRQQWVPTVHIRAERKEDSDDPKFNTYEDMVYTPYDRSCSACHTTIPAGDWLLRNPYTAGDYSPYPLMMSISDYLHEHALTPLADEPERYSTAEAEGVIKDLVTDRISTRVLQLG